MLRKTTLLFLVILSSWALMGNSSCSDATALLPTNDVEGSWHLECDYTEYLVNKGHWEAYWKFSPPAEGNFKSWSITKDKNGKETVHPFETTFKVGCDNGPQGCLDFKVIDPVLPLKLDFWGVQGKTSANDMRLFKMQNQQDPQAIACTAERVDAIPYDN